jgi:hypothetical protein
MGKKEDTIALHLKIDVFLWWASFMPPCFYFSLFVLYYLQGRWANYIPSVSETGTEDPNEAVMAKFFPAIAGAIFYCGVCMAWYFATFFGVRGLIHGLTLLSTVGAAVGFVALSNCPRNVDFRAHFLWTSLGLGCTLLMQMVAQLGSWRNYSLKMNIFRGVAILAQVLFLLGCAHCEDLGSNRVNVTISALGEYGYLIGLPFFFMSFAREMSNVEPYLLLL